MRTGTNLNKNQNHARNTNKPMQKETNIPVQKQCNKGNQCGGYK